VTPPNAPGNLTASATGATTVALAWTDNSSAEDGFKIERKINGGTFNEIATIGSNITSYNDAGLSASTTYVYRVRAFRATESSDYSNQISATTTSGNVGPTFSISDVSITEGNAGTVEVLVAVSLANPNGQSATVNFQIVDGTAARGEDYSIISSAGTMTFFNGGATTQRVRVTILGEATNEPDETILVKLGNATNATIADNQGIVTILNDDGTVTPPNAPGNLTASATGTTTASLAWTDNSSDEDGFKIERKIDGGSPTAAGFTEIAMIGHNANSFNDTGLSAGATYVYRVRAFKAALNSSYTNEAMVTTTSLPPAAPGNLSATATGASTVALAWTDNSTNEDGFKIERKIPQGGTGTYNEIATIGSNVTSYNDAGLGAGTTYVYRVRAYLSALHSDYSNEASATTSSIGGGGSGNLALNQLVAASGTYSGKPPENAVDGSTSTYWRSGSASKPVWLSANLGATMTIGRVIVRWHKDYYAKKYEVQVSTDEVNWKSVYTATGKSGAQTFNFSPQTAQYVRLYFTKSNTSSYRVAEFEAYSGSTTTSKRSSEDVMEAATPDELVLAQNYPNPFWSGATSRFAGNPSTKIEFSLPQTSHVTIKIYTINGVEVATLADEHYAAGAHEVIFKPKNLPSGTYFYVMQAGEVRRVRQLMLLK
jgi:hypothetical protein